MPDITAVLQQNSFKVSELLRSFRIIGPPTMPTIEKAFNQYGERFMIKLLEIITPTEAAFTDLITPMTGLLSSAPLNTSALMPMGATAPTATTGKAWTFWNNLLTGIGKTGEALGKFKNDLGAEAAPTAPTAELEKTASQTKTLYIVAGAFVALIVIILLFRK